MRSFNYSAFKDKVGFWYSRTYSGHIQRGWKTGAVSETASARDGEAC